MKHSLDRNISLEGRLYTLRFSMASLAGISFQLGAVGPLELAQKLRLKEVKERKKTVLILVNAFLLEGHISDLSTPELNALMPLMADMIVEAFHG